jgi:hypothetical protein
MVLTIRTAAILTTLKAVDHKTISIQTLSILISLENEELPEIETNLDADDPLLEPIRKFRSSLCVRTWAEDGQVYINRY